MKVFDVEQDLKKDKNLIKIRKNIEHDVSDFLFDPNAYTEQSDNLTIDNYFLHEDELLEYALMCSRIRRRITDETKDDIEEEKQLPENPLIAQRLQNYDPAFNRKSDLDKAVAYEDVRSRQHRPRFSLRQLSALTRLDIIKAALAKRLTYEEIADRFRVKRQLIYDLVKTARKKPERLIETERAALFR